MRLGNENSQKAAFARALAKICREAGLLRCELNSFEWHIIGEEAADVLKRTKAFRVHIERHIEFLEAALLEFEFLSGKEIDCSRNWQSAISSLRAGIQQLSSAYDTSTSEAVRDLSLSVLAKEFGYPDGVPWNSRQVEGSLSILQEMVLEIGRDLK